MEDLEILDNKTDEKSSVDAHPLTTDNKSTEKEKKTNFTNHVILSENRDFVFLSSVSFVFMLEAE